MNDDDDDDDDNDDALNGFCRAWPDLIDDGVCLGSLMWSVTAKGGQ